MFCIVLFVYFHDTIRFLSASCSVGAMEFAKCSVSEQRPTFTNSDVCDRNSSVYL